MANSTCEICSALDNEPNNFIETEHWRVNLALDQAYLGRCYVTLKSHKPSLSSLTAVECTELHHLIQSLESACSQAFGATLFNWSCLTNNAFKESPYNPHVHWHFRPRYEQPVNFADVAFVDPEFGHHYDSAHKQPLAPELIQQISAALRQFL